MKVILLEEIPGLGALGAVVRVKDGFARNFLLPRRKAERATKLAVEEFERRRADLEERQRAQVAALENAREALDGCKVKIAAKAGPDGGLYGSVTPAMIAAAVNRMKPEGVADFAKGQVHMPAGHLKQVGESPVEIVLRPGLKAQVIVAVAAEGEEGESAVAELPTSATASAEDKLRAAVRAAAETAAKDSPMEAVGAVGAVGAAQTNSDSDADGKKPKAKSGAKNKSKKKQEQE